MRAHHDGRRVRHVTMERGSGKRAQISGQSKLVSTRYLDDGPVTAYGNGRFSKTVGTRQ